MKFFLIVAALVAGAAAHDHCAIEGTVVTETRTVVTTTHGASGSGSAGSVSSASINEHLLSARDRQPISQTWALAKNDGHVAPKTFLRLFQIHPQYQQLFPAFADVSQAQLAGNGNFLAQAYTVMAGLDVMINTIGSSTLLAQELSSLGVAHFSRKVKNIHFVEFSRVLIEVLQEELGSQMSAEAKTAWENGLKALTDILSKNLREKSEVANPITGLTPGQVASVAAAWNSFRADRSAIGQATFLRVFEAHPEYQSAFAKFASVAPADLAGNVYFQVQSDLVINRVDTIIANLDNTLTLLGNLKYMGHSHAPRSITRQHFENFEEALLEVLAERAVSEEARNNLDVVLTVLIGHIASNLH